MKISPLLPVLSIIFMGMACARTSLDSLAQSERNNASQNSSPTNTTDTDAGSSIETDGGVDNLDSGTLDAAFPTGPDETCVQACEGRLKDDPQCFADDYDNCIDYCDEIKSWRAATQEAFYTCLKEDPLCFQSLTNCTLILAYPEPVSVQAKFVGTGFEQFEGKSVYARFDPGRDDTPAESQVFAGKHELLWELEVTLQSLQKTIYYFVDTNDDGRCDPRTDRTQYGTLEFSGTIEAPAYFGTRELQSSPNSAAQICRGFD